MIKKQFAVYGLVQGVGFRYFTWKIATQLNLVGTVKNRSDGSVFVIACGDIEQITEFTRWLKQGPKSGRVENLICEDYIGEQHFTEFKIIR